MKAKMTKDCFRYLTALGIFVSFVQPLLVVAEGSLSWEQKQLHQPSEHLLRLEERGRVTIYDAVHESDVDRAMDEQFGRIENMMFVRTQYTLEDGSTYESDDCD